MSNEILNEPIFASSDIEKSFFALMDSLKEHASNNNLTPARVVAKGIFGFLDDEYNRRKNYQIKTKKLLPIKVIDMNNNEVKL